MVGTYALSKGYYDVFFKKASQARTLMINDFKETFRESKDEEKNKKGHCYAIGGRFGCGRYLSELLFLGSV